MSGSVTPSIVYIFYGKPLFNHILIGYILQPLHTHVNYADAVGHKVGTDE